MCKNSACRKHGLLIDKRHESESRLATYLAVGIVVAVVVVAVVAVVFLSSVTDMDTSYVVSQMEID